jgi:hypothetical protein
VGGGVINDSKSIKRRNWKGKTVTERENFKRCKGGKHKYLKNVIRKVKRMELGREPEKCLLKRNRKRDEHS